MLAQAVVFHRLQGRIRVERGKVQPGPAAVQGHHAGGAGVGQILLMLALRGLVGGASDHRDQGEDLECKQTLRSRHWPGSAGQCR